MTAMPDLRPATVALSQLYFDLDHNSRQGTDEPAMVELINSIEHNGLITPLTVRPSKTTGNYYVIDGHRRLEALNRLYGHKREETHVPVLVRAVDDANARALSLAANIVRLPLHPADQYKAFAAMLDEGMEEGEIATRFHLPVKDVQRVLALGRVIPAALALYKEGRIDADTVKLFASVSEERQLAVWKHAYEEDNLTRWQVHRLLTDNTIKGDTPIARLVGEERYEQAGGRIERSLFTDETRWLDVELALTLAKQRMGQLKEELLAEGWAFVMVQGDMPKNWQSWSREYAAKVYTDEVIKDLHEIETRMDEIEEIDADDLTEENEQEMEKLEDRQRELEATGTKQFTAEQKAASGVVLMEDYSIIPGLKWPAKQKQPEPGAEVEKKPEVKPWSQALLDEVNSHGTVAAQLAIMREPNVADCMLLAGMYQDTVHDVVPKVMALNSADRFADTQVNAGAEIQKALKSFGIKGAKFWSVYEQIAALSLPDRERLRSVLVARAMRKRHGSDLEELFDHLSTTDLPATWVPDRAFFDRLNTAQLSVIYKEVTGFGIKEGTKKTEAVDMTLKMATQRNWVPKWLRKGMPADKPTITVEPKKQKGKRDPKAVTQVGEDGKSVRKKKAA
jgi:ParB family transcriptional regulator, chromosome partitioning protein